MHKNVQDMHVLFPADWAGLFGWFAYRSPKCNIMGQMNVVLLALWTQMMDQKINSVV